MIGGCLWLTMAGPVKGLGAQNGAYSGGLYWVVLILDGWERFVRISILGSWDSQKLPRPVAGRPAVCGYSTLVRLHNNPTI